MDLTSFSSILLGFTGFYWVFKGLAEFYLVYSCFFWVSFGINEL